MVIYDNHTEVTLFEFFSNESKFFYGWLTKKGVTYLICAEDLFGGQTIIDVTNGKMESFSPGEEGFMMTEFYLAPNGNKLAVVGCYWACPYIIKFFDFEKLMKLPLKQLNEIALTDNSEQILGWKDNHTLTSDMRKEIYV